MSNFMCLTHGTCNVEDCEGVKAAADKFSPGSINTLSELLKWYRDLNSSVSMILRDIAEDGEISVRSSVALARSHWFVNGWEEKIDKIRNGAHG